MHISLIGAVDDDDDGIPYQQHLDDHGIDTCKIRTINGQSTGIVFIMVEETTRGDRILAFFGANGAFTAKNLCFVRPRGRDSLSLPGVVVAQLEFTTAATEQTLESAGRVCDGAVLNASLTQESSRERWRHISISLLRRPSGVPLGSEY